MNILVGFLTGLAASMGLGGGFILIIWLTFFCGFSQSAAQGVNLMFFLPVALFSALLHSKNKLVEWKILPVAIPVGLVGAAVGSILSFILPDEVLGKLFGGLILIIGVREILGGSFKRAFKKQKNSR